MFPYKKQKPERHRRSKKYGIKDENIDRQILAIHKAIAEKLLAEPDLCDEVSARLNQRLEMGKIRYGEYITWVSILEHIDDTELFLAAMLDDSFRMKKFRRRTPFSGILSEKERLEALQKEAIGTIDVSTLI